MGLLGGRVAETLCLGDISTGASNDIQRATEIAQDGGLLRHEREVGTVSFESGHDEVFIGRTMSQGRSYSEAVAAQIDEEVKALVGSAYERCRKILDENRDKLETVARYLRARDHGAGRIFGGVPHPPRSLRPYNTKA